MALIRITRWLDGKTLHEVEASDLREAMVSLVERDANLRNADLRDANLSEVNLRRIRDDIFAVLSSAPAEAGAVLAALRAGKVDGSTYAGECACLVGTVANARGCAYDALPQLTPDSSRLAEVWFTAIKPGDTPDNSTVVQQTVEWVEDWIARMQATFGARA